MVLYFSGTGNTRLAASRLAKELEEPLHSMEDGNAFPLREGERLVLVSPLYFWGLPTFVPEYLRQQEHLHRNPLDAVICCGGAIGGGERLIRAQLRRAGFPGARVHPLVMTTNYIPWHEVDPLPVAAGKLHAALADVPAVAQAIRKGRSRSGPRALGAVAPMVYALYGFARRTRHFHVTDRCIGCGLCARDCPTHAIRMEQHRPRWTNPHCTLCLRCVHRCPTAAIEHGRGTVGKKRYQLPEEFRKEG